jgi:hypothetical protein
MTKRALILKIGAIANAIVITTAFVGCPARKNPAIVPDAKDPMIVPAPIATPPFVTIAPYGGNFQHVLPSDKTPQTPSPPVQDTTGEKRTP